MPSESRVNATDRRVTSDDKSSSSLYREGELIEVADHRQDGTTQAHEPATCWQAFVTGDARGTPK